MPAIPAVLAARGGLARISADAPLGDEGAMAVYDASIVAEGFRFALVVSDEAMAAVLVGTVDAREAMAVPEAVSLGGSSYPVVRMTAGAVKGGAISSIALPATLGRIDEGAFANAPSLSAIEVAEGNPAYASFDGALYDAALTSLLLIPEGRAGSVRIPSTAEEVPAARFSHCPGVASISVDAGGAALSSEDGLLYDATGVTLLRVPVGATRAIIADGCAYVAAGAVAGCASLQRIEAPSSVEGVSPDALDEVPVAGAAALSGEGGAPSQISQMVMLAAAATDDRGLDPGAVEVSVSDAVSAAPWRELGFAVREGGEVSDDAAEGAALEATVPPSGGVADVPAAALQSGATYNGLSYTLHGNGGYLIYQNGDWTSKPSETISDTKWPGGWVYQGGLYLNFAPADETTGAIRIYPTRHGYYATHWSEAPGGPRYGGDSDPIWIENDKWPANLYMNWAPNVNHVTFDAGGGTGSVPPAMTVTYDRPSAIPACDLKKTGYHQTGWRRVYDWDKWGLEGDLPVLGPITQLNSFHGMDETLLAIWEPNTYTVEWWNKAGTQKVHPDSTFTYDVWETLQVCATGYITPGYRGVGWAKAPNQASAAYGFHSVWPNLAASGTLKLYMAEAPLSYAVSFDANGGFGGQSAVAHATFDAAMPPISTAPPARTGYSFAGWYDTAQATGGTQYYTAAGASARSWDKPSGATLYARWVPNPYTVEYWDKAGATKLSVDAGFAYDAPRVLAGEPSVAASVGYHLAGWADAPDQPAAKYGFGSQQSNLAESGIVRLYLAEEPNHYQLAFDANGGEGAVPGSFWLAYDESRVIDQPQVSRAGYALDGWAASAGGPKAYGPCGPFLNVTPGYWTTVTLYARWVPIVAVDAPVGLDIEMDVLGVEAQRAGSGKLVSRSGAPLEVAEVSCEPVAETAQALFGWGSQDEGQVSLTVAAVGAGGAAGSGVTAGAGPAAGQGAPVAFALGGPSKVGDPSALAPFALPGGYGSELSLSYGIAMPEGYAIPSSYPAQRTPIAKLVYTVRLAGEAA